LRAAPVSGARSAAMEKERAVRAGVAGRFAERVVGGRWTPDLLLNPELHCILIGRINQLRHDLAKTPYRHIDADGKFEQGNLQDVVRVKRFLSANAAYKAGIHPDSSTRTPATASTKSTAVAVFDGARGYLKFRDYWWQCSQVILLDRAEPQFQFAVDTLNQSFVSRRESSVSVGNSVPESIELMGYEERSLD
jgi:hypothetical protein